jgi:hypothetical protein
MSKATVSNPTRACIFTVTCVSREGRLVGSQLSIARRYSISYRWESWDHCIGAAHHSFDPPTSLAESANWSDSLSAVTTAVGRANQYYGDGLVAWEPLFLVHDGGDSKRLCREIERFLVRWSITRSSCRAMSDIALAMRGGA